MKGLKETAQTLRKRISSSKQSSQQSNGQSSPQQEPQMESQVQESQNPPESAPQSQPRSSDYVSNQLVYNPEVGYDTGNYMMQKIKFRRWNLQKRQFEYLIKWRGYSESQCTWQTTQDILRQPCLQLKDLGKKSLLANFQRTHAKTLIYNQELNKDIGSYQQTEKNHLKYASKELIEQMERQLQQLYGEKKQQKNQFKLKSLPQIKIEVEQLSSEAKFNQNLAIESFSLARGFQLKNVTIQKLIYFPFQFEMKILVRPNSQPTNKRLLTCSQIMNLHPETGIICYKAKLAMIQKWKKQNLPRI